jgi:hypothetical protein
MPNGQTSSVRPRKPTVDNSPNPVDHKSSPSPGNLKIKHNPIRKYVEGHTGTFVSAFCHACAIVPHPFELELEPFLEEYLQFFYGGDETAAGMSRSTVVLHFFSTSDRSFLVCDCLSF